MWWRSRRALLLCIMVIGILSIGSTYLWQEQTWIHRANRIFLLREERESGATTATLDVDFEKSVDITTPKQPPPSNKEANTTKSLQTTEPSSMPPSSSPIQKLTPLNPKCRNGPVKDLMFLKTHKTGSSTVQNVLVRHAYKENLFIGLPREPILFRYYGGNHFRRTFMKTTPPGKKVNMLVHHMVFDYPEVSRIIPRNATYFTVLRDPATQFESVFHYLQTNVKSFKRVLRKFGVGEYARDPKRYFKGPEDGNFWWFGKNNMVFDLGFNNTNETDAYIQETREKVDSMFDLVLIAEYFDISLMLLKELLCWDIEDMVYLSMNARNQSTVENVTDDVKEDIYSWNKADTALYRYYNETFWKRVEEYGETRLQNDLEKFDKLKKEFASFCVEDDLVSNKDIKGKNVLKMFNPPGLDITQYRLKPQAAHNDTCIGMILPEKAWYGRFDTRQYPRPLRPKVVRKLVAPRVAHGVVGKSRVIDRSQPRPPSSEQADQNAASKVTPGAEKSKTDSQVVKAANSENVEQNKP